MKCWKGIVMIILSLALLFPNAMQTEAAKVDVLKGDNHAGNSFAVKSGSIYYVNNGYLQDKPNGIYKVGRDMKTFRLIKKGEFTNIHMYLNSIVTFNEEENILQRFSPDGKMIREYPQVASSNFLIEKDLIYYHTGNNMYQLGINGRGNKHLLTTKGYIQEYTVHNGWLYFVTSISRSNDPYDMDQTNSLSKIKIAGSKKVISLVSNAYNIDSIIVRDGYIYSVIHRTSNIDGRPLYRMNYSGKNVKRVTDLRIISPFIGKKYMYSVENSHDDRQKFFRATVDGKNMKTVGVLPGRMVNAEYHDGEFLFEVQNIKQQQFLLHRIHQQY
ncbi:DUF5050 domain-containing protein [Sporosarcina sp. P13]|uniref:DUF5050 domain-containing protein n=1 Tax=Sporosarcina sp. P13 TaxID=2048263 RepID=UPI0013046A37|nr:DUF5050 domain-containing protein [Sporosarcina sp. P13]